MKNTPALIYDNCFSDFLTKLTANTKSSQLDWCNKIGYIDSEDREVTIYYRSLNVCKDAQTDNECNSYQVERVTFNGEPLEMDSVYEREIIQHLNFLNPLN